MSIFKKAILKKKKGRIAVTGPAKSGKTTAALKLARGIVGPTGRIVVLDSEHESATKTCAGDFEFYTFDMLSHDPRLYIDIMKQAEDEGFDAIILDSYSHAWMGKGGILDIVDNVAARSRSGNTFTAFKEATPIHQSLIEAISACKCHVIATMRAKTEYVLEPDPRTGKNVPRKVGLAAVQREGVEYEFDILVRIEQDHTLIVDGSRYKAIDGKVLRGTGWLELGQDIGRWLDEGATVTPTTPPEDSPGVRRLKDLIVKAGMSDQAVRTALSKRGAANFDQLTHVQIEEMIRNLETHIANTMFVETFPHVEPARAEAEEQERLRAEREAMTAAAESTEPEAVTAQ